MESNTHPTPLVSVIIPTYNGDAQHLLREAACSILAQTWKHLELIVILDGPVGLETSRMLEALERTDHRVCIIALPHNQGPAHARNAGIASAFGEYIALLDADDLAAPERIERQVRHIETTGADVVGSWHHLVDAEGATTGSKQTPVSPRAVRRWMPFLNPIANSTVLARASVLRDHPFPAGPRAKGRAFDGEDYALWVSLARQGRILCNLPECLVDFRTGMAFLERRRGMGPFRSDLSTKLQAAALYPIALRPIAWAGAVTTSLFRLLPTSLLAWAYRLRAILRFSCH